MNDEPRLNLGAGSVLAEGWVNADRDPMPGAVYADMAWSLPWPDDHFAGIVVNHALQHVSYLDVEPALREMRRVLRPGGVLRLLVPDVMRAFFAYRTANDEWFPNIVGHETTLEGRFSTYLTWFGTARSVFTRGWLVELCQRAGFAAVATPEFGESKLAPPWITELDSRQAESILVECRK